MKVRFIESPTGVFGLAYFVGDVVTVNDKQGQLLVESGCAEAITSGKEPEPEPIQADEPVKEKQHAEPKKRGRKK